MTITTTLTTEAVFSNDGLKRYQLVKTWDSSLPKLAIIMLAPSAASGIALDSTTSLVLNNADRLGFGSVSIVNLFATLNDFALTQAEPQDAENLDAILSVCRSSDRIVYAPGTGKSSSKVFQRRQEQVLTALLPYESKLSCLSLYLFVRIPRQERRPRIFRLRQVNQFLQGSNHLTQHNLIATTSLYMCIQPSKGDIFFQNF